MIPLHPTTLEFYVALVVVLVVLEPISVLCHELGHAAVALRFTKGPVLADVGFGELCLSVAFERLTIKFRPRVYGQGFRRGFCRYGAREAGPKGRMYVALAGPLATGVLALLYVALAFLTGAAPAWIQTSFALAAFACFVSFLINLDPRETAILGSVSPFQGNRDGPRARAAYRQWRSLGAVSSQTGQREWSSRDRS